MRDQQTQQTSPATLKLFGGRRLRLEVLLAISLVSLGSCLEPARTKNVTCLTLGLPSSLVKFAKGLKLQT
jgi:hypothetical protein